MSPLLRQRIAIVAVLAGALALCLVLLLRSETSSTVKVVVGGILIGLLAGGFITAYRSGKPE